MKKPLILGCLLTALAFSLSGCFPEGEGRDELIKPSPIMGPAGGESQDQTAPIAPEASSGGNETAPVFPSTDQPTFAPPDHQ